jgi:hypothetical protein
VICAGGHRLFTNAWVCMRMLRHFGCELPIQFWYLDEGEMDRRLMELVRPFGVECVNARDVAQMFPARKLSLLSRIRG